MKALIKKIIKEETDKKWEYQVRDIGGLNFYKRKVGDEVWSFTTTEDFVNNVHKSKIVKWDEKSD